MKHLRLVSQPPAVAQFESILQFIGVVQAMLSLYQNIAAMFGITVPQKGSSAT